MPGERSLLRLLASAVPGVVRWGEGVLAAPGRSVTLPVCDADREGAQTWVRGGVGAASTLYWCAKNASNAYAWVNPRDAAALTSGVVAPARLGSGTSGPSTFLRGDSAWVVPASPLIVGSPYSGTWDPPSVAAGAQTNTTISYPGAVTTDLCLCSHNQHGTTNLQLTCHVAAADSVRVVMSNANAAGSVDLASGTLTVTVMRNPS